MKFTYMSFVGSVSLKNFASVISFSGRNTALGCGRPFIARKTSFISSAVLPAAFPDLCTSFVLIILVSVSAGFSTGLAVTASKTSALNLSSFYYSDAKLFAGTGFYAVLMVLTAIGRAIGCGRCLTGSSSSSPQPTLAESNLARSPICAVVISSLPMSVVFYSNSSSSFFPVLVSTIVNLFKTT